MGKDAPDTLGMQDYSSLMNQQAQINQRAAEYQTGLNRPNQQDAFSSTEWRRDPTTGVTTQVNNIDPAIEAAQRQQIATQHGASSLAGGLINSAPTSVNMSGAPQIAAGVNQYDSTQAPAVDFTAPNYGGLMSGVSGGAVTDTSRIGSPTLQTNAPNASSVDTRRYSDPTLQTNAPSSGALDTRRYTDPSLQTGLQDQGRAQRGVASGGDVQSQYNFGGAPGMPAYDEAARNRSEQGFYGRQTSLLQPGFTQQENDLRTRLANQGLTQGSEAFERELGTLRGAQNATLQNASFGAVQAGADEAARQYGLGMQGRQQGVNEAVQQGQFGNAAQQQRFGQNAQQTQQYNAGLAQDFGQGLDTAQFGNQARVAQQQAALTGQQAYNQIQQQQFGQGLDAAQFSNQARLAQQQAGLTGQQAYNQSQQQQFGQGLDAAQFSNQARLSQQGANIQGQQAYNQAQQQQFGQGMDRAGLFNSAATQDLQNQLGMQNQYNTAQQQQYNQNMGLNDQYFSQAMANAGLQNQARQQYFNEAQTQADNPYRWLGGLMGAGGSPTTGGAGIPGAGQYQNPVDLVGAANNAQGNAINAWSAQNAGNAQTAGAIASMIAAMYSSDEKLKFELDSLPDIPVEKLDPVIWKWVESGELDAGVVAQEVQKIAPELVETDDRGFLTVNYTTLFAALLGRFKQLKAEVQHA